MPEATQTPPKPSGETDQKETKPEAPQGVDIKKDEKTAEEERIKKMKEMEAAQKKAEEKHATQVKEKQEGAIKEAQKAQAGRTEDLLKASGTAVPTEVKTPREETGETKQEEVKPTAQQVSQPEQPEEKKEPGWFAKFFGLGKKKEEPNKESEEIVEKAATGSVDSTSKLEEITADEKLEQKQEAGQNPEQK